MDLYVGYAMCPWEPIIMNYLEVITFLVVSMRPMLFITKPR